jgi:hypothetical protein
MLARARSVLEGARCPRGAARLGTALGLAAALSCGLLVAQRQAPALSRWLAQRLGSGAPRDVAFWTTADPLSSYLAAVLSVAFALAASALYLLCRGLARDRGRLRHAPPAAALACLFVLVSFSGLPAALVALVLAVAATLLVSGAGGGAPAPRSTPRTLARAAVIAELVVLGWGSWLVTVRHGLAPALGALGAVACFAAWRLALVLRADGARVHAEALGGACFLPLPLLGLGREPPALVVVLAAGASLVVARFARRRAHAVSAGALWAAASLALAAVLVVPLGLRDLPSVNLHEHEAQHLGWINSALDGKLLMADAGFIYGPLRTYLMAGYCLLAGTTLLQVRVVSILLNLAGLGVLLAIGFGLVRQNLWIHAWLALLLLILSPLWALLDYRGGVSLGWADLGRVAAAVLAMWGAVRAASGAGGRPPLRMAGWGAATAASTLYSHEYGLCALGAVLVTTLAEPFLRRRAPFRSRLAAALATSVAYLAGFGAAVALWLALYAAHGRAGLFLRTLADLVVVTAGEGWGALPFPVGAETFTSLASLLGEGQGGARAVEFALPPGVYALAGAALLWRAVRARWNERASFMLALALFGITTFRVTTVRADVLHLLSATVPAVLLLAALCADVATFAPRGRRRLPIGLAAVVVVASASPGLTFFERLGRRLEAIVTRREVPPSGPPHRHPEIERAGDVHVPEAVARLVAFLRANTGDGDPIFCAIGAMVGPEIYFLADRRNPTRYDMLVEAATHTMQRDMLEALRRDPPRLVVSARDAAAGAEPIPGTSPELGAFLAAYRPVMVFGDLQVSAR